MIPFYFDEDASNGRVVAASRRAGLDIVTAADEGLLSAPDPVHLARAIELGRVLVSSNARDYWRLHTALMHEGRSHPGIVLIEMELGIGEWLRGLLAMNESTAVFTDRVIHLATWRDPATR